MSGEIMSLFGSLASSNIDERVSAATSIVSHLAQPDSIPPNFDLQHGSNASDLGYALKRLVRGLASPTPGARLGFSIALCEVGSFDSFSSCAQLIWRCPLFHLSRVLQRNLFQILKRVPQLSPQVVFDLILSATPLQSGLKASEERDSIFGRLFGIKCIIQSGVLVRKLDSSQEKLTQEQLLLLKRLLDELSALVRRAPWLAESSGSVLVSDLTMQILRHPDSPLSQSGALDCVVEKFLTNVEVWTLEQLSLVILLQQHSVKLDWKSISKTFPNKQILNKANHEKLFTILIKGDGVSPAHKSQSGSGDTDTKASLATTDLPIRPHFIHGIIMAASSSARNFDLSSFYNHLFEHHYFAENATVSRRSHGFLVLNNLIKSQSIPDGEKPNFLTFNCLDTLRVQLAAEDRLLHKMAQSVVSNMISASGKGNAQGSPLAKGLASRITTLYPNFDQGSRSKLIRSLVYQMESPELTAWTQELVSAFHQGSPPWPCQKFSKEEYASQYPPERFREFMLAHLCGIISMKTLACTTDCASSIVRCLTLCAFFGESTDQLNSTAVTPSIPFPPGLRELCKARLYTYLFDLVERTRPQIFDQKRKLKAAQTVDPLSEFGASNVVVEILNSHCESSTSQKQLESFKSVKGVIQILSQLRGRVKAIKSKKLLVKREALVLLCETLYLMAHDEQDGWTEALPLIERLAQDLNTLLPSEADSKALQTHQRLAPAIANLTESLLFLLSWPIALLRAVVEINFDAFSDCIGRESLQLLVDKINPPESIPEDESIKEDDDEENDSSAGESDTDQETDTSETMTADGSVDEEFRNDIAMALGHALSTADHSDNKSDDESELMDDDEMLALDANLANIFKRRSGKKLTRVQNTQDLHLRMKILELIGKFIKLHPGPLTRGYLIKPLLELIGKIDSHEVVMKKKVVKILEDAMRLPCTQSEQNSSAQSFSAAEASDIATTVHLVAQTTRAADTVDLCAKCNLWLVDVIQSKTSRFVVEKQRQQAFESLVKINLQSLENFCSKRSSKLRPTFFSTVFKRFPSFGWLLRDNVLSWSVSPSTVNAYRREQMLQLVSTLINKCPPKNQSTPSSIQEFDTYLKTLKQAVSSVKEMIDSPNPETGLSKDQSSETKVLKKLTIIVDTAQGKSSKLDAK